MVLRKLFSSKVAVTAVAALCCVLLAGLQPSLSARAGEAYEQLKTFADILTIIQTNYVEEVDIRELMYSSIKGMVSDLDPHSSFMPPDLYKELQVETKGSFGGLGIEITMKDGLLTVVSPIENTPAYRAGIQTGDTIMRIENEPTKDMGLVDAVKRMRGRPGTRISITIMRVGLQEPRDYTIERDIIQIKSVRYSLLKDSIAYIRIAQFQENTVRDFRTALTALLDSDPRPIGLVLDLRSNPGGLLDQAVKLSDEFLDGGLIVYTEGRLESQKMQFFAEKNEHPYTCPTVVLVNGGSASASEIVAGALQDHGIALIVGSQTFGKGTVQTIYPLNDGSGLRITTAKYYTPDHRSIQERGITPDIVVADTAESFAPGAHKVNIIREKDLQNHIEGVRKPGEDDHSAATDVGQDNATEQQPADPPLQTAMTILKSWNIFQQRPGAQAPAP